MERIYLPEQNLLLPLTLRDWRAYLVSDLIDELNLSAIKSYYPRRTLWCPAIDAKESAVQKTMVR